MSDFERNIRKTNLENLHSEWTEQKIEEFYDNKLQRYVQKIAFARYQNGYINAEVNAFEYVDASSGNSYKIRPANENNWTLFNTLKDKADQLGTFRIETPVYRSASGVKEYVEVSTPNSEFGKSMLSMMMHGDIPDAPTMLSILDDIFSTLESVLAAIDGNVYPKGLFLLTNYWKDSQGWFVSNLDTDWSVSKDEGIDLMIKSFKLAPIAGPAKINSDNISEMTSRLEGLK
jgi:hypothetical protein